MRSRRCRKLLRNSTSRCVRSRPRAADYDALIDSLWRGRTPRQSIHARSGRSTREGLRRSPTIIMKRNTDVSRLRPAAVQESAETGTQPSSCDAAMERATVLLVHGLQQSDIPISQLSCALARMAQTLADIGTPLFGPEGLAPTGDGARAPQVLRDAFARDLAICIESLQFHDR